MKRASGLTARTVASHRFHSSVSRAFRHSRNCRRSGSRGSVVRGKLRAGGGLEVLLAVHAVAVAALRRPAVGEDAVDLVPRDDLAVDLVHELEVVGAERAGHPQIGVRPVPPRLAGSRRRQSSPDAPRAPRRARRADRCARRRACRARGSRRRACRTDRFAQPGAAMVQRHLGRVVGDDAAGAERGGVGVQPPEVVEPELRVEPAGIVLDQRQLHPAHRPVEPAGRGDRAAPWPPARPAGSRCVEGWQAHRGRQTRRRR